MKKIVKNTCYFFSKENEKKVATKNIQKSSKNIQKSSNIIYGMKIGKIHKKLQEHKRKLRKITDFATFSYIFATFSYIFWTILKILKLQTQKKIVMMNGMGCFMYCVYFVFLVCDQERPGISNLSLQSSSPLSRISPKFLKKSFESGK